MALETVGLVHHAKEGILKDIRSLLLIAAHLAQDEVVQLPAMPVHQPLEGACVAFEEALHELLVCGLLVVHLGGSTGTGNMAPLARNYKPFP